MTDLEVITIEDILERKGTTIYDSIEICGTIYYIIEKEGEK
jgi:hypothetical protein